MYINKYYYHLKLFIPRSVQIAVRSALIRRKMNRYKHLWPIDYHSVKPPEGWRGWPDGKAFAFVLTHDIETAKGLSKCEQLTKIEEELGFRSSFNFVAGDYDVPMDFIDDLKKRGFEVGVHGYHHNGNMFRSQAVFDDQAAKINFFLNKWDAVGFRHPSMYHNLDMLHGLNIEYDASTFDTDPFEPQPDAMGTIFPVWIAGKNGQTGYVEIPYTLCQDFLAFIMLKQNNLDLWTTKLDWLAENGGMALVNVHPDYMSFDEKTLAPDQYPAQYYIDFLKSVRNRFVGKYWQVLPRDLARFWKNNYASKNEGMIQSL